MTDTLIAGLWVLIVGVLTCIVGVLGIMAKKILALVTETNDAVNRRHERKNHDGEVPPKLYDLAIENHAIAHELKQWKDGYKGGPLDDGEKVQEFVGETRGRLQGHSDQIRELKQANEQQHKELFDKLQSQGMTIEEIEKKMSQVCKRNDDRRK